MRRRIFSLLATGMILGLATGCAGADGATGGGVDRLAEARAALPASVKQAGSLAVGTDPSFAPMTFKQGEKYTGLDVELTEAIAAKLGLKVGWQTVSFGDLLDKVQSHSIDVSVSSMFDRAVRQQK